MGEFLNISTSKQNAQADSVVTPQRFKRKMIAFSWAAGGAVTITLAFWICVPKHQPVATRAASPVANLEVIHKSLALQDISSPKRVNVPIAVVTTSALASDLLPETADLGFAADSPALAAHSDHGNGDDQPSLVRTVAPVPYLREGAPQITVPTASIPPLPDDSNTHHDVSGNPNSVLPTGTSESLNGQSPSSPPSIMNARLWSQDSLALASLGPLRQKLQSIAGQTADDSDSATQVPLSSPSSLGTNIVAQGPSSPRNISRPERVFLLTAALGGASIPPAALRSQGQMRFFADESPIQDLHWIFRDEVQQNKPLHDLMDGIGEAPEGAATSSDTLQDLSHLIGQSTLSWHALYDLGRVEMFMEGSDYAMPFYRAAVVRAHRDEHGEQMSRSDVRAMEALTAIFLFDRKEHVLAEQSLDLLILWEHQGSKELRRAAQAYLAILADEDQP
jgi:hypothetical protein